MSKKKLIKYIIQLREREVAIVKENVTMNSELYSAEKELEFSRKNEERLQWFLSSSEKALIYKDQVIDKYKSIVEHLAELP